MTEQPDLSGGVAFVDGGFVPRAEAKISVFDLGFLLSDCTYDVVHVWQGSFFRLEEHLDRFEASVAKLRMDLPYSRDEIREIATECVRRAGLRDAYVQMIATRGLPNDGRRDLRRCTNNFIAFALPFVWLVPEDDIDQGVSMIISDVVRIPPESVDPTVKNFNRLDFSQSLFQAYDRGADYALLLNAEGNVTEGLGYNIFARMGERLVSPDGGVLEGVTRKTVMEMARQTNLKAELGDITADEMRGADEIFMATTAGGITPVTELDGAPVGDGRPGPLTQRLSDMYWAWHGKPEFLTKIDYDAEMSPLEAAAE
jgi:branched-chain amino acid aminotransferase